MTSIRGRQPTSPWKKTERDTAYQRRIQRAQDRGQFTEPGTLPNARDEAKVARKRKAR